MHSPATLTKSLSSTFAVGLSIISFVTDFLKWNLNPLNAYTSRACNLLVHLAGTGSTLIDNVLHSLSTAG